tara:strand:+ start:538 stop:2019 length:1482 start_codon:yes stop_codon:yes gene_type:complete
MLQQGMLSGWQSGFFKSLYLAVALAGLMMLQTAEVTAQPLGVEQPTTEEVSQQELDKLIRLLEDPSAREAFLQQVKTFEKVQQETGARETLELSDALQLDQKVGLFLKNYLSVLSRQDLSASSIGKIAAVAVLGFVVGLVGLLNMWLARTLDSHLKNLRRRLRLQATRFGSIFTWQRYAVLGVAVSAWVYASVVIIFEPDSGSSIMSVMTAAVQTLVATLLVVLLFLTIWELTNAFIESIASRENNLNSRRAQTLLPILRNVISVVIILLSTLVIFSELGIDVVPLLAGAGVVGIAIGFGAQTLVKDFLTGFTILIEDLLQIGDVVSVAGRTGYVQHISMRKIELRSLEGTVHTIPFSAIDIVDNLTKDFSYYMLDVGVAYRENTDDVVQCLQEIDEDMRASDEFGQYILEPLEVLGVDQFADSAVVIKARTKTIAREKWRVGREFNRRIKQVFDARNIEIPFPHQTLYFGVDKDGNAPPLPPMRHSEEREDA